MAKIKSIKAYDGAENKSTRLGLQPLIEEVKALLESTRILGRRTKEEGQYVLQRS